MINKLLSLTGAAGALFLAYDVTHPPLDTGATWCIFIVLLTTSFRWLLEIFDGH